MEFYQLIFETEKPKSRFWLAMQCVTCGREKRGSILIQEKYHDSFYYC